MDFARWTDSEIGTEIELYKADEFGAAPVLRRVSLHQMLDLLDEADRRGISYRLDRGADQHCRIGKVTPKKPSLSFGAYFGGVQRTRVFC